MIIKTTTSRVIDLISEIDNGKLGLPELQRGYVWEPKKVRDLFDSMYKGFPIGYLMIWDSPDYTKKPGKQIGIESKGHDPKSLVIDGQQRLTSLDAVMCGKQIVNSKFVITSIIISFNPITKEFAVGDSATERAHEWIYNISDLFLSQYSYDYINEKVKSICDNRPKTSNILDDSMIQKHKAKYARFIKSTNF